MEDTPIASDADRTLATVPGQRTDPGMGTNPAQLPSQPGAPHPAPEEDAHAAAPSPEGGNPSAQSSSQTATQ